LEVDEIVSRLCEEGYCKVPGVLDVAESEGLDARAQEIMDSMGDGYVSLEGALNYMPELASLCTHPLVMGVGEQVLGPGFILANSIALKWCKPGTTAGGLHADWPIAATAVASPGSVAPPWGGLQVFYHLRESTPENGATRIVPFSHHTQRGPSRPEYSAEIPVVGQTGDLFFFHNMLWHRTGANTSSDQHRMLANIFYIPAAVHRSPFTWPLVKREVFETFSAQLQEMLARSTEN